MADAILSSPLKNTNTKLPQKERVAGVLYKLTFPNGKAYIGITSKTATIRFKEHVKNAKSGRSVAVSHAINKNGSDSVVIETLIVAPWEYLIFIEPIAIRCFGTKYPNGYNISSGGEGVIGVSPSKETRERLRNANLGKKASAEAVRKMKESSKSRVITDEMRQRFGNRHGKKASQETIEKLRILAVGREPSACAREKARIANTGRVRSSEEVEKIRSAMAGRVMTDEHKNNLRKSATGRVMSKESIEKQWATRRANAATNSISA